jgi:hypothetical protein
LEPKKIKPSKKKLFGKEVKPYFKKPRFVFKGVEKFPIFENYLSIPQMKI